MKRQYFLICPVHYLEDEDLLKRLREDLENHDPLAFTRGLLWTAGAAAAIWAIICWVLATQ
jgi:hypothetical protein